MMKCKFCGAESTNYSTYFRNEPVCERCFEISVCISSFYHRKADAEKETRIREPRKDYTGPIWAEKKEAQAMKVEYNGFAGELVKLERTFNGVTEIPVDLPGNPHHKWFYTLSIYDAEKKVTHTFTGVKLEDVKFLGGVVSFG